jgi:hypothetical protein
VAAATERREDDLSVSPIEPPEHMRPGRLEGDEAEPRQEELLASSVRPDGMVVMTAGMASGEVRDVALFYVPEARDTIKKVLAARVPGQVEAEHVGRWALIIDDRPTEQQMPMKAWAICEYYYRLPEELTLRVAFELPDSLKPLATMWKLGWVGWTANPLLSDVAPHECIVAPVIKGEPLPTAIELASAMPNPKQAAARWN